MSKWMTLGECPPGPFQAQDSGVLGFKTEYRQMEVVGETRIPGDQIRWRVGPWSEVYVMASGEAFWGGASDPRLREELIVRPVEVTVK